MMSEEFFEALTERISKKAGQHIQLLEQGQGRPWFNGFMGGRDAAIKALKEMMVGEPMEAELRHSCSYGPEREDRTFLYKRSVLSAYWYGGHYGTDGEEVAVFVVRMK